MTRPPRSISWAGIFRTAFLTVAALAFIGSLFGIYFTGPVVVRVPPSDLVVEPSVERLRASVDTLCGRLAPRNHRYPGRLNRVAIWLAGQLEESGLDVEFQDYRLGKRRYRNVIAKRPGSNPDAGVIVIGAHYDSYGEFPGADDNASGVAVLLELARTLPRKPPDRTHYFVAFSTEEPPYFGSEQMGSYVFAESLAKQNTPVELMIALEMVGYYSSEPGSQGFPLRGLEFLFPDRGNFLAIIGDHASGPAIRRVKRGMLSMQTIPVRSFRAPVGWAPVDLSDHWSFRKLGMPAVQVTDTAFMRNPHYHTPEDTPDTLNYERMADVVRALHGVLWQH